MSSNTKMMDTEAGGESTQYESIKTVTVPHSKQGGQLGEFVARYLAWAIRTDTWDQANRKYLQRSQVSTLNEQRRQQRIFVMDRICPSLEWEA